jgi:hypothetical protein
VANTGLTAYVKWKSAEALENKAEIRDWKRTGLKDVTPVVFARVRNTGLK